MIGELKMPIIELNFMSVLYETVLSAIISSRFVFPNQLKYNCSQKT